MTKKIVTAACALALGIAWTMAPASAADDTKEKMERAKDKTENKADTAKDKMGNAVDKTKEKASDVKDKTKEKASEITDKTKAKTAEVKDKIKNKISGRDGADDVRKAQEALMAKGHNPGPIDGKMGPQTSAAIKDFQTKENMKVTGRLDSDTKAKLNGTATSKVDTSTPAASPTTAPDSTTTKK